MAVDPETFTWAAKCLNGEVSREMRMVALQADGSKFKFRYYLDSEPTDFVRERAELVAVNFDAGLAETIEKLEIEFVLSTVPLGKLDNLDVALFRRWENSSGGTDPEF